MADEIPRPVVVAPLLDKSVLEIERPLHELHKTPIVLYGIFIEIVRQLYSNPDNFPLGIPADVRWTSDPAPTRIWIDTDYVWEDTNPEVRPAIYTKLSDITFASLAGRKDGIVGVDIVEGEKWYATTGTGSVSWVHIGRTNAEALVLAGATLDYLQGLSQIIRDDYCFQTFSLASMSPLQAAKESKERYHSIVTFSYSCQDVWVVKTESPKLRDVTIRRSIS
jgi:hypothetical protein